MSIGYVLLTDDNLRYVGITYDLKRRLREHRSSGPMKGRIFRVEKVEDFSSMEAARAWEIDEIASRGGVDNLLNTSTGGHGGRGRKWTSEMRANMSEKARIRQADSEFRKKMSVSCKAAWADPNLRAEMSRIAANKCADPVVKAKRSQSQKKSWACPAIRKSRVAALTAHARSEKGRERRRRTQLRRWHGDLDEAASS